MASTVGQNVRHLERLAVAMYSSTDANERRVACTQLSKFQSTAESIPQCQQLLEHSSNLHTHAHIHTHIADCHIVLSAAPEAQLLASSSLLELLTSHWKQFEASQTVDMRNYLLNYLAQHEKLPNYVASTIIRTVARITKLGWESHAQHRDICSSIMKFLEVQFCFFVFCFTFTIKQRIPNLCCRAMFGTRSSVWKSSLNLWLRC